MKTLLLDSHVLHWLADEPERLSVRARGAIRATDELAVAGPTWYELAWLRDHVRTSAHLRDAPFRVIAMHQPRWGWLADGNQPWIDAANDAAVDLVIAGHTHRFSYTAPGPNVPHRYHLLVVGQDQVARVDATSTELKVVVTGADATIVHTLVIPRRK